MAKKMLLVPEMEFQRLRKCDENISSNILEEVKRPNEGALVKNYTRMERVLQDPLISDGEKVARHVESMNDFLISKDKLNERQQNQGGQPSDV